MNNKDTNLFKALQRLNVPALDAEYYVEQISLHAEGEWLTPSNNGTNDYSIFSDLAEFNLVQVKRVPSWSKDGMFRGLKVMFMYKLNLQYGDDLIYRPGMQQITKIGEAVMPDIHKRN